MKKQDWMQLDALVTIGNRKGRITNIATDTIRGEEVVTDIYVLHDDEFFPDRYSPFDVKEFKP